MALRSIRMSAAHHKKWRIAAAATILSALVLGIGSTAVAQAQQAARHERPRPNADLFRQYRQAKQRSDPRSLTGLQEPDKDGSTAIDAVRRVTIQCSVQPLFQCASCAQALQDEQDSILSSIMEQYPQARLISSTRKIVNALFVYLPLTQDDHAVDAFIDSLPGVQAIVPGENYRPAVAEVVEYIGGNAARQAFCVTGRGVRVAVLDSGIDYTHAAFGGPGTTNAFDDAYGIFLSSVENTQRDGLFPTERVVDGYDFVGDVYNGEDVLESQEDDDPIDLEGHGTAVASTILGVAPQADLIAIKVCATAGLECPDFAIIAGIEYALDPNGDGSMDDKVDIINFSLGVPYTSGYYSTVAKALDDAFELGVLTIVAAGNNMNSPFNIGEETRAAYTVSVSATGTSNPGTSGEGVVEGYASRGPGENNSIKPDITAPAGFAMASAATGDGLFAAAGTSFSAPLVAGVIALLKERCPECSPMVLRTILMNNVDSDVKYASGSDERAPISLVGSGEVRADKAVEADYYAYCLEEVQPSLSLGLIDAAADVIVRKTLRVVNLSSTAQELAISFAFREQSDADSGAVAISFNPPVVTLGAECGDEALVEVEFRITAALAPSNTMTSGGTAADDFRLLDRHEFDGWVTLSSTDKDISLPFHMLLRQAAEVTVANTLLPSIDGVSLEVPIGLVNNGAGVAQIDSYELIFTSEDDPERDRGSNDPPSDLRYVGYRVVPVFEDGCDYLLEFAITTWERTQRLYLDYFDIVIDTDGDFSQEFVLFNSGPAVFDGSSTIDCRLRNVLTGDTTCTGFVVDHATNTANTILRVCSNDLNLTEPQEIKVGVITSTFPTISRSDGTTFTTVLFPEPALSAPSYDILPGPAHGLDNILVSGPGRIEGGTSALGLLLISNAYRSSESTGAATKETEAVALLSQGIIDPPEVTPDIRETFVTQNINGPTECSWEDVPLTCPSSLASVAELQRSTGVNAAVEDDAVLRGPDRRLQASICPENPVPRSTVATRSPTTSPTMSPIPAPSVPVTQTPTTLAPTMLPTTAPITASPSVITTTAPTTLSPLSVPTAGPSTTSPSAPPSFGPMKSPVLLTVDPTSSPTSAPSVVVLVDLSPSITNGPSLSPTDDTSGAAVLYVSCSFVSSLVLLLGIWVAMPY